MRKLNLLLGLGVVLVLVIATNLIDRKNFEQIDSASKGIYSDRLVALDILYDYLKVVHQKQAVLAKKDVTTYVANIESSNKKLKGLKDKYDDTELTTNERKLFNELQENFNRLKEVELKIEAENGLENTNRVLADIVINLDELGDIQLDEANLLRSSSDKAINMTNLLTTLEIVFIVLIIIFMFIIYFVDRKKVNKIS